MGELWREDKAGKEVLASVTPTRIRSRPNQAGERRHRCQLGRVILMMGILRIFVPADRTGVNEKKLTYEGIQGLLENVAMGIEEKQAEMREMDQILSTKRMEQIELEKTIRRRQTLLDLKLREIEEVMLKLAALGWGSVTSILVITAKAWTIKPPSKGADVSTSMG
jgi:hypothetical protein